MIIEYHRPETLAAALNLLARPTPKTLPLGGGTVLGQPSRESFAVVDLQNLGLDEVLVQGQLLEIGAAVTLQKLIEADLQHAALAAAIRQEASANLRQVATVAGTLVAADGRSPLTTVLLALDARLQIQPEEELDLGDLLPLRAERLAGRLITHISVPINATLAYHTVARTPGDWPLVCTAVARWPAGRTRVALGGYGPAPILAFDGPEIGGVETAVRDAYSRAGDAWASATYRQEISVVLARRALAQVSPKEEQVNGG